MKSMKQRNIAELVYGDEIPYDDGVLHAVDMVDTEYYTQGKRPIVSIMSKSNKFAADYAKKHNIRTSVCGIWVKNYQNEPEFRNKTYLHCPHCSYTSISTQGYKAHITEHKKERKRGDKWRRKR